MRTQLRPHLFMYQGQCKDFLLTSMGMRMIAEITPPMMTIWSVDPLTDLSPDCGVGVTCLKRSSEMFVRAPEGAE
jgi:hypothetical protein